MVSLELEISITAAFCRHAREAAVLPLRQRIETQARARSWVDRLESADYRQ